MRQKGPGFSTSWRFKVIPALRLVAPTKVKRRFLCPSFQKASLKLPQGHSTVHLAADRRVGHGEGSSSDTASPQLTGLWEDALWCLLLRKLKLRSGPPQRERRHLRTTLQVMVWLERISWRTNIPRDRAMRLGWDCVGSKEPKKNTPYILKNVSSVLFSTLVNEIILEHIFINDTALCTDSTVQRADMG